MKPDYKIAWHTTHTAHDENLSPTAHKWCNEVDTRRAASRWSLILLENVIFFSLERGNSSCLFYILKANLGMSATEWRWKFCHSVIDLSSNTDKSYIKEAFIYSSSTEWKKVTGLVKNLADEGIKSLWPRVYKPITFQISSIINVFLLSRLNVLRFGNEDAFLLKKKKSQRNLLTACGIQFKQKI